MHKLIQKLKEVEKNHPMSGVKVAIYIAEDMLKQEQEVTEGTTPVEQLFHKLWDTPKDKWTWYAELAEAKRKEKERTMSAQMDMFNFLNNLDFGMQYLEKREQAEEFAENYGGNT